MGHTSEFHNERRRYENAQINDVFFPHLPIIIRCDGRNFHSFTRGFERPYDQRLQELMRMVCRTVVEKHLPCIGYTQSDELTFVFLYHDWNIPYAGRKFKILGEIQSTVECVFNYMLTIGIIPDRRPESADDFVHFDCRGFQVPTREEAVFQLIDRERDATRNAITMAAQAFYSDKELFEMSSDQRQEMLFVKGINFNEYPQSFKRGSYFQRKRVIGKYNPTDINLLPPQHDARKNPNLDIERWEVHELNFFKLAGLSNKEDVIFQGADPE